MVMSWNYLVFTERSVCSDALRFLNKSFCRGHVNRNLIEYLHSGCRLTNVIFFISLWFEYLVWYPPCKSFSFLMPWFWGKLSFPTHWKGLKTSATILQRYGLWRGKRNLRITYTYTPFRFLKICLFIRMVGRVCCGISLHVWGNTALRGPRQVVHCWQLSSFAAVDLACAPVWGRRRGLL